VATHWQGIHGLVRKVVTVLVKRPRSSSSSSSSSHVRKHEPRCSITTGNKGGKCPQSALQAGTSDGKRNDTPKNCRADTSARHGESRC